MKGRGKLNQALGIRTEAAKAAIPAPSMKKVKREQSNTVPLPQKNLLPKFTYGQKATVPELHFSTDRNKTN